MPNTISKNLNLCFTLLKRPQPQISHSSPPHHQQQHTFNYNSLYDHQHPPDPPRTTTTTNSCFVSAPASPSSISTDNIMEMETETDYDNIISGAGPGSTTPDLTAAYASQRFFISSPGRSNSIVDSLSLSSSSTVLSPMTEAEVAGGVPVQTYSPDPYVDFRRSMQEMVEARELGNLKLKQVWEYLQELLLSYLALNPKNTHKYIIGAFTDLVVTLMSPPNNKNNSTNNHASPSSFSSSSSSFSSLDHIGSSSGYIL